MKLKKPSYDKGQSLQTAPSHIHSCVIEWKLYCLGKKWGGWGAWEVMTLAVTKYLGQPSSEGSAWGFAPGFYLSSVSCCPPGGQSNLRLLVCLIYIFLGLWWPWTKSVCVARIAQNCSLILKFNISKQNNFFWPNVLLSISFLMSPKIKTLLLYSTPFCIPTFQGKFHQPPTEPEPVLYLYI